MFPVLTCIVMLFLPPQVILVVVRPLMESIFVLVKDFENRVFMLRLFPKKSVAQENR